MIIDLVKYLTVAMILFILGIWGIFMNRKNIIVMLMSIELMLLAVNLNFIIFSVYLDDLLGQVFFNFYFDNCCCRICYRFIYLSYLL